MNSRVRNMKSDTLPQKNTFSFNIKDKSRLNTNKNRKVTFSSDFDSGNLEQVTKVEEFKVNSKIMN